MENFFDCHALTLNTLDGQHIWRCYDSTTYQDQTGPDPSIEYYIKNYIQNDEDIVTRLSNQLTEKEEYEMMTKYYFPVIEKVIVNGPATIVYFDDNSRVIVKRMGTDKDDLFSAVAQAYCKKAFGSTSAFHREVLNKLVVQETKEEKENKKKARKEVDIIEEALNHY